MAAMNEQVLELSAEGHTPRFGIVQLQIQLAILDRLESIAKMMGASQP